MKIVDKLQSAALIEPYFSLEFFPPKTEAGVDNLFQRMDRLVSLQPAFVAVTWGAGGCTAKLSLQIATHAQTFLGADVLLHLTCTNLTRTHLREILAAAREVGIQNILALRGDPPKGSFTWEPVEDGCANAMELVQMIREESQDAFCIGVAGFPEGSPQGQGTVEGDLFYLKQKVDSGADFILTQFFFDPQVFLSYRDACRAYGINCPIIPGIMPIQSFSSFVKMTSFCKISVPQNMIDDLTPIRDDDERVKAYGVAYCKKMCDVLRANDVRGFHFFTLNLETSVISILGELGVIESLSIRKNLPFRASRTNLNEDVRPINWANRPKSYIYRTVNWDEFPNGRWGDNRSPAFGDLSDLHFFRPMECKKEDLLAMWGEAPLKPEEVYEVFAQYLEMKIPIIPWCESALQPETHSISKRLVDINRAGFLTINSQPAVNGVTSDHPVFGWGGPDGMVYQKAYVEFFTSPENLALVLQVLPRYPKLSYYAVNSSGDECNCGKKSVAALTWGVFPDKEILQPTVFDYDSFLVWAKEGFMLWSECWASLYDDDTESSELLYDIHDTYYLVAIVDNDFTNSSLFNFFDEIMALKMAEQPSSCDTSDSSALEF